MSMMLFFFFSGRLLSVLRGHSVFFIPATTANDLRLRRISIPDLILSLFSYFKLYLFYNDYKTSYTTYINHARWHRCLRSDGLRVGGNRSARRKPTCLTWWPHDHLTCRRRVSNPGRGGERRVCLHCACLQTAIMMLKSVCRQHTKLFGGWSYIYWSDKQYALVSCDTNLWYKSKPHQNVATTC